MDIDQSIYNTAIEEGFSPMSAKLIVAQARLESGHYGSDVFKANNNMFGMKYVAQPLATRGTLAPPNERSEVEIENIQVAKYQQMRRMPDVSEEIVHGACKTWIKAIVNSPPKM